MVKFTSARPSIGGMKSYYNHRTAFGGQWRNLRPQPRTSTTINFRSYNYNNCCSPMGCGGGFGFSWFPKAMGWMNMFSMGANLLGGILNMFMPQQPTYPVYPTEQKIDNKDNKKINELEKEIEELKKQLEEKKVEPEKKKEPEKVTDDFDVTLTSQTNEVEEVVTTEDKTIKEDVKYEPSYHKETDEVSYWYDFADAYDFKAAGVSRKDVYHAIQQRNGYTSEKPNCPQNVMLPLELQLANGTIIKRKDTYTIHKQARDKGPGNGKGQASGGTPNITNVKGSSQTVTKNEETYTCTATYTDENGTKQTVTKTDKDKDKAINAAKAAVPEQYKNHTKFGTLTTNK